MSIGWLYYIDSEHVMEDIKVSVAHLGHELIILKDKHRIIEAQKNFDHSIIFIHDSINYDIYQLSQELMEECQNLSIILTMPEEKLNYKKAYRLGILDLIVFGFDRKDIFETILNAEAYAKGKAQGEVKPNALKDGKIISICSTKGGVGKTSILVNLSLAYAMQKKRVAILDLNLQFGDVALMLNLKPKRTIYDWVKEYSQDAIGIENCMVRHESGVYVMAAPSRPEFSEAITEEHANNLIQHLRTSFDVILIDTPAYLSEIGLTSLENSDDILLTTYMDLPTLKNSKLYLEALEALNLIDKVKVMINRVQNIKGLNPDIVEEVLGLPIFAKFPNKEKIMTLAINEGNPIFSSYPKNSLTKKIIQLAHALSVTVSMKQSKEKKKSLLKKVI